MFWLKDVHYLCTDTMLTISVFQFWIQGLDFARYDGEKCDDTVQYFPPDYGFGVWSVLSSVSIFSVQFKAAKKKYYTDVIIENKNKPRVVWKFIKQLLPGKSKNALVVS